MKWFSALGLLLVSGLAWIADRVDQDKTRHIDDNPELSPDYTEQEFDRVDRASLESFPASDSPAW